MLAERERCAIPAIDPSAERLFRLVLVKRPHEPVEGIESDMGHAVAHLISRGLTAEVFLQRGFGLGDAVIRAAYKCAEVARII